MNRALRHKRIRKKIKGNLQRPRLSVYRSLKGLWTQIIDDDRGETLVTAHYKEIKEYSDRIEQARQIGKLLAQKAKKKNIGKVVFDRNGCKYHGRIKALSEGAREGGIEF